MKTTHLCIISLTIPFFLCFHLSLSQSFDPDRPPNTYASPDNPYYWKNKLPYPGYWQQDVYYNIQAVVDDRSDIITGNLLLVYTNNSPDTLPHVFFHLYQNAFQPGSYLDNIIINSGRKARYGRYESQKLGTVVESLQVSDAVETYTAELFPDNTILKVMLKRPLLPNSHLTFRISFKTYFDRGSERRRMKLFNAYGFKHYDGVHWYPRICVYDRKFGWNTDQHLGREFYGNFGTYDVRITLPEIYIMEATGTLQNRAEVMPDTLRKKLDLKNFADKPWGSPPSLPIVPSGRLKTWHFYAENVHDFAWTADPTYRIGEAWWQNVQCIALVQEPHASRWQNAAEYTARIIEVFSTDIGRYAYPKMVVADARDGMEYPMLTLDSGYDPVYRGLLVHEVGHNWFFGMVGNNETYRALLDEGFTQWLTAHGLERIDGKYGEPEEYDNWYQKKFKIDYDARTDEIYWGYYRSAIRSEDGFLNTHSDKYYNKAEGFQAGYRMVYRKTATMLYNLQYVLGDSLFFRAMQFYFNRWKMAHPYPEDFRQAIIDYTKVDLNWFFDQWLETDKRIDYKIASVRKASEKDVYRITFKRKERMEMPLDFSVYSRSGKKYDFHIPNQWFVKETHATVLPKWFGWDILHPTYTATVQIPGGIHRVVIDTSRRLADINLLNNVSRFPLKLHLDSRIANIPDRFNYELFVRPDLWYNSYDGIKAGLHLEGNYLQYVHQITLDAWLNTGVGQGQLEAPADKKQFDPFSVRFAYRTPLNFLFKNSFLNLSARKLDGLNEYKGSVEFNDISKRLSVELGVKAMKRNNTHDLTYLLFPGEWQSGVRNNYLFNQIRYRYGKGSFWQEMILRLQSATLFSDYDFSRISLTHISRGAFSGWDIHLRLFGQYTAGNLLPRESSLFLAGANPEEMMEEKFTRARGFYPDDWLGYGPSTNHFHYGGGLNLRGYAGYLVAEEIQGEIYYLYKGHSGVALNLEVDFDRFIPLQPSFTRQWLKVDTYLFGDAGYISGSQLNEEFFTGSLRADAGLGMAITIKKFGPLEKVNPFTLRFDMPLFLNRPPFQEKDYLRFRWLLAVSRAF